MEMLSFFGIVRACAEAAHLEGFTLKQIIFCRCFNPKIYSTLESDLNVLFYFFCRGLEYESTLSNKQQAIESEHRAKYVITILTLPAVLPRPLPSAHLLREIQYCVTDYEDVW